MTDRLKNYIDANRPVFDSEEPRADLFARIDEKMHNKPARNSRLIFWKQAAIFIGIFLLGAGAVLLTVKNNSSSTELPLTIKKDQNPDEISFIGDASYARQILQFREVIGLKQEELKQLKKDYPDLYKQFVDDVNELDSSYESLKIKLAETPNKEMLLEAMIQNLQLQSELLNRQLLIIKEIKQKTKSHAKTNA